MKKSFRLLFLALCWVGLMGCSKPSSSIDHNQANDLLKALVSEDMSKFLDPEGTGEIEIHPGRDHVLYFRFPARNLDELWDGSVVRIHSAYVREDQDWDITGAPKWFGGATDYKGPTFESNFRVVFASRTTDDECVLFVRVVDNLPWGAINKIIDH